MATNWKKHAVCYWRVSRDENMNYRTCHDRGPTHLRAGVSSSQPCFNPETPHRKHGEFNTTRNGIYRQDGA